MASKPSPRYVVLDDVHPSINYTGSGWFQDSGTKDNIGNFGPPYLYTLHGTSVDGSVSLEFNGTTVRAWGTNIVKDAKTNPDPTLECFVDDVSIGREKPFEFDENNWLLCQADGLSDGPHKFRMDVKVASKDQTFWLDQIQYVPSKDMPLDGATVLFSNLDPAIRFDAQWQPLGDSANMTTHTGSTALVDFVGASVSWVAFIPTERSHSGATGSYFIDSGKPTQFLLKGLPSEKSSTVYNQFLFTTPPVEPGPHTLTVTFLGSGKTTPLCLDFILVQNGTFPSNSGDNRPQISGTPGNGTDSGGSSPTPIGAILGGILGALALLILIVAGLLFWRRQEPRRDQEKSLPSEGKEFSPTPFNAYSHHHHHNHHASNAIAQVEPQSHVSPSVEPTTPTTDASPLMPMYQESSAMKKQRLAFEVPSPPPSSISGSSNGPSGQQTTPAAFTGGSTVYQHQDSGLRLHTVVEDVPPFNKPE